VRKKVLKYFWYVRNEIVQCSVNNSIAYSTQVVHIYLSTRDIDGEADREMRCTRVVVRTQVYCANCLGQFRLKYLILKEILRYVQVKSKGRMENCVIYNHNIISILEMYPIRVQK